MLRRIVKEALSIYREPPLKEQDVDKLESIVLNFLEAKYGDKYKEGFIDYRSRYVLAWHISKGLRIPNPYHELIASYVLLELKEQIEKQKEQGQHE